jgi:AraC family transcriptional regulator
MPQPDVRIVDFPETRVAAVEHRGPPALEHETARRLIAWRIEHRLPPDRHATYGIHYTDPRSTPPDEHRADFCVAFDGEVAPNPQGVVARTIPAGRCAVARHHGSRADVRAATYLHEVWLPASGEALGDFPVFFHYVNVGPGVREEDMITDVYLPLR